MAPITVIQPDTGPNRAHPPSRPQKDPNNLLLMRDQPGRNNPMRQLKLPPILPPRMRAENLAWKVHTKLKGQDSDRTLLLETRKALCP